MYLGRHFAAAAFAAIFLVGLPALARAEQRIALVIGNSSYRPGFELRNPVADARAVAKNLSDLGFAVTVVMDSDLATAQRALDSFVPDGIAAEAALIYYAGHGAMINGRSFMLPTDFSMSNFDEIDKEALATDRMLQTLSSTHAQVKMLLFDACRNNPLESRGATVIEKPEEAEARTENTLIAFSTAQGAVALDGAGDHSPFAEGLLDNLRKPEELSDMMRAVSLHVREKTDGRQTVWLENSLTRSFYFTGIAASPAVAPGKVVDLTPPEPDADIGVIFPQSSEAALSEADLAGKDSATLRLARNEIFARHGRIFNDPALKAHFEKFGWYRPATYEPALNAIEKENVALIRQFEMTQSAPKAGFLFVDSDRRLLTAADLKGLSKGELRNARNEIYARRGRKFVRKEVSNYFKQFDWYRPQFGEVELTFIEAQNVALIQKFEKAP
ncbi:MAG: YARHG domain-containing protein [Parvibaculaceae bacterium]